MAFDSHEAVGINAFGFALIVILCVCMSYLLRKHEFGFLPESGAAMILGMAIGAFMLMFGEQESEEVIFSSEVFFFVILPPIIFEAGFTLERKRFFSNLTSICLFAVLGTFVSTLVVGYGLYFFARIGAVPINKDDPLECLMFGALISAVDPVATLAILGAERNNADPMLYSLVFGESVLNDAVSIVLFNTFKKFHKPGSNTRFDDKQVFEVIGQFFGISLGSILLGSAIALFTAFFMKRTSMELHPPFEFALVFFFSYISYCAAEIVHLSGIMALFFCGIVNAHYTWHNLSKVSQTSTKSAFKSFGMICEQFLFAYLGITSIISTRGVFGFKWDVPTIVLTLLLCVVARFLNIFPLGILANIRRRRKISYKMMLVMWFAGLRGAIAFALSLNMDTENEKVLVTTTMSIVIFTTLVCGGFTETVLRKLGMQVVDEDEEVGGHGDSSFVRLGDQQSDAPSRAAASTVVYRGRSYTRGGLHYRWRLFDDRVMKPLFGGESLKRQGAATSRALTDNFERYLDTPVARRRPTGGSEQELDSLSDTSAVEAELRDSARQLQLQELSHTLRGPSDGGPVAVEETKDSGDDGDVLT